MNVCSSGAEAMESILRPIVARQRAEATAHYEAELTRFARQERARMMRDLDAEAARMKGAACSTRRR